MKDKIQNYPTDTQTPVAPAVIVNRLSKPIPLLIGCSLLMINTAVYSQTKDYPSITKAGPEDMVGALNAAFGDHHVRAVHAKGIVLEGSFTPSKDAKALTKAIHMQGKAVPVTFRFSDFTGIPDIPDTTGASMPRGLAIKFHLPDGGSSDIVCHSFNGFPVPTTDDFRDFLLAISKSTPTAPHPNAIEQYVESHPVAKTFVTTQKPPSVSYGTLSYFGVNAFKFTNAKDQSKYIRYQVIPEAGEQFLNPEQLKNAGPNYLSEEIKTRIIKSNIKFKLYAQIAEDGDKVQDPSIAWPDSRKRVLLGTFSIERLGDDSEEADKKLNFSPGNLVDGIEGADPMITDRRKAYPISVERRQ